MAMYEPLNVDARLTIVRAQEAAQELGHSFIAPEHFIIGLLGDTTPAAQALISFGVTREVALATTRTRLANEKRAGEEFHFTPRAKRAFESAFQVVRAEKRDPGAKIVIGPEHLLLGIARAEENEDDGMLKSLGVSYDMLRGALAGSLSRVRSVPFVRVDHVQLAMLRGEEERARSFYAGILGMEELRKPADLVGRGGVWFKSGSVQIHLGVDDDFHPARKAHPALQCADLKKLVQTLREHGIEVQEVGRFEDNRPHAYVFDPFGNRLEFIG